MSASTILIRANDLIHGQRADDYGKAIDNFTRIARRWSEHLNVEVTPEQVCLCMIELKLCRLIHTPDHEDSWIDIAGYVGCKGKIDDKQ